MPIDTLVLHYTGMRSAADAIERLCDPAAKVSSHYVVDEDGRVLRLVAEAERAAHAGVSHWRGREGLNDRSIGIEIVNPGHEWGYRAFPERQIAAVTALARAILERHPIPARNVVAHSDVAPDRKQDPGELFPWRALAQSGIGVWPPAPAPADVDDATAAPDADPDRAAALLRRIGYRVAATADTEAAPDLATVLRAFQRHWRPSLVSGALDRGTLRMLEAVAAGA